MKVCKKGDYKEVAKKASELLKEGIGISEIINSTQKSLMNIKKLNKKLNRFLYLWIIPYVIFRLG